MLILGALASQAKNRVDEIRALDATITYILCTCLATWAVRPPMGDVELAGSVAFCHRVVALDYSRFRVPE